MFNHTAATTALTAALTFSAFGVSTGNDPVDDAAKHAASLSHVYAGSGSTSGSSSADAAPKSGAPSLGDRVRVRQGTTSRTLRPYRPSQLEPSLGIRSWEDEILSATLRPYRPAQLDPTFDNQFWEDEVLSATGGDARNDAQHDGPMGDAYQGDNEAPVIDPGRRDPAHRDEHDINGDGHIDFMDLVELLSAWGRNDGPADLTGDGIVSVRDLYQLLSGMPTMDDPDTSGETGSESVPPSRNFKRADGRKMIEFSLRSRE